MGILPPRVCCSVLLFHVTLLAIASAGGIHEEFILEEPMEYSKSDAGGIWYLEGCHEKNHGLREQNVALSFIRMEPTSLLLPHYFDSSIVFYVHEGEALLGWVREGKTMKKELRTGDVFSLPAGTVSYILNTHEADKLHMVGILDTAGAYHKGKFQPFFVGGGVDPQVTFAGFDGKVLSAAFKVSEEEVMDFISSQTGGPIIRTTVGAFDEIMRGRRLDSWNIMDDRRMNKAGDGGNKKHKKDEDDKEGKHKKDKDDKHKKDEDDKKEKKKKKDEPFNLFEKRAFENKHGWVASTFGEEVSVLRSQRAEVSVTKLNPGSLVAPHWNNGAEFGIVTNGTGTLEIAYPNGTNAVTAKIRAGTVFFVPQFLPSAQISAFQEPLEFVSFIVSSTNVETRKEDVDSGVHFLAGSNSVFKSLDLEPLALSFNVPDMLLSSFLNAQNEAVILSSSSS